MTGTAQKTYQAKVEEYGAFFERFNWSPVSARIYAYLLLADPGHQTMAQIAGFLNVSKSAVSNGLRRMLDEGLVEYITFNGDRHRYFRISSGKWLDYAQDGALRLTESKAILREVLVLRRQRPADDRLNAEIEEVLTFYEYMAEGIQRLINRWKSAASN